MKRTNKLALSVMLIVGVTAVGAAGAQVATMNYAGSAMTWSPLIENEGFTLTVSGGGQYFRQEFKAGQTPSFSIFDNGGEPLADGVYTWELTPVLSRAQIERGDFAHGKTSADGSYARQGRGVQSPIQSGHFRILNGALVDPSALEAGTASAAVGGSIGGIGDGGGKGANALGPIANQIITGDAIVYNSICVGFDCPSNPTFGADTIRLQENNLRIHFDDTSTAGSFPRNDWRIVANSNANGGGEFFAIQDSSASRTVFQVEAGARSNALYVDDAGRVGLGTATPSVDLHIKDGDTPTLRLEQDTSSGFAAQTWDVAGNETSFFVRDATNGSTLPFRIRPTASSNSLVIDADDDVGIGILSPDTPLHVDGSSSSSTTQFKVENDGAVRFELEDTARPQTWVFRNSGCASPAPTGNSCFRANPTTGGSSEAFQLTEGGDLYIAGAVNPPSSRSIKENIYPVDSAELLNRVSALPIHEWSYIKDKDKIRHVGPMAEDFWAAFRLGPNDKVLSPSDAAGVSLAAVQALTEQVRSLEGELAKKDSVITTLIERLEVLEATVQRQ